MLQQCMNEYFCDWDTMPEICTICTIYTEILDCCWNLATKTWKKLLCMPPHPAGKLRMCVGLGASWQIWIRHTEAKYTKFPGIAGRQANWHFGKCSVHIRDRGVKNVCS